MPTYLKPKPNITGEDFMTTLLSPSTKAPTAATRSEVELLFCCARTHIDSEIAERIRTLLQQDIDWAYLMQTAVKQGIMPLLYQSLNTTCPEAVPKANLAQLRNYFHTNAQRNLFLTKELLKLLTLFESHSIPAIPFKGPVLAVSAYGNLSLRRISDLDILVREQDYHKAKKLLLDQGHRMVKNRGHEAFYLQAQMWHEEKDVSVDLHYGIQPKHLQLNSEIFLENLQPLSFVGTRIQTFSPETHLLILCIEGKKEGWNQFSRLCDVAALINSYPQMNWESLTEQARRLKIKRILDFGLVLANTLLKAPVPASVLSSVKQAPLIKWLITQLGKNLFSSPGSQRHPFYLWATALYQGELHRLLLYWLIPNEADLGFLPLPRTLHFLYYLIRPVRLVGKYGLAPFQALFKRLYQEDSQ
jgi:hypothetical protein